MGSSSPEIRPRSALPPDWPRDLAAMACLLGLALLLLSREILWGGSVFDGDIILQSIPVYSWFAEGLRQGRIPIWSTEILGGFPLAFSQYGLFYPPDILLFRILDPERAFHLSLALHLALAGVGAYWYCRILGLRRGPALLAGVAFQMGNEVLSWPANGFITRTLFVLPALLAVIELALRRGHRYGLLAAPIVAAGLLGGYAQIVLFGLALGAAYLLAALVAGEGRQQKGLDPRLLAYLILGVALGFGLSAVRVLPTMELTALSTRAEGMGVTRSAAGSIEPWALVAGYLLPAVFDLPGRFASRPDYLGAPVLLLAGLTLSSLRRLPWRITFHWGAVVAATLLSVGTNAPFYGLLAQMPYFSYFRGPNRFSLLAALSLAVLAAWALDRGIAGKLSGRWRFRKGVAALAAVAGLAAAGWLALSLAFQFGRDPLSESLRASASAGEWGLLNLLRPRVGIPAFGMIIAPALLLLAARNGLSRRLMEGSLVVLTGLTLFTLGWIQNDWLRPADLHTTPGHLATVRQDSGLFRLFSWAPRASTYNVGAYYTPVVGSPPSRGFEERYFHQFIPPNLNMLMDLDTIDGYEVLQTRRQAILAIYMGSDRTDPAAFSDGQSVPKTVAERGVHDRLGLLAALNVKYLLHAFEVQDSRLEWLGEVSERIYPDLGADAKVHLYRLRDAMPRAFAVPSYRLASGEEEALDMVAAGVGLEREVILEKSPAVPEGPGLSLDSTSVEVSSYGEEEVVLRVASDGAGFLVLMDALLPGWSATLNGNVVPILAANFAGRAVQIPGPGDHEVRFEYNPPSLREGWLLSLLSGGLLIGFCLVPVLGTLRRR